MSKTQLKNILAALMIDPVSSKSPFPVQSPTLGSPTPVSQASTSTLSSMQRPSLIIRFFSTILEWIRWIFCCKSTPTPPPVLKPILDPADLPSSDPFRNAIFNFDSTGKATFKNLQKFQLASNIFKTLGTGGTWHWYWNRSQLVKWHKELDNYPLNPFEFLYFLFHNQEMTTALASFNKNATTGSATMMCTLIGRKNPWDEFIEQESQSFATHSSPEVIPGFCKLLDLDESLVTSLFNSKKWEDLIFFVLNNRKKQFSVN